MKKTWLVSTGVETGKNCYESERNCFAIKKKTHTQNGNKELFQIYLKKVNQTEIYVLLFSSHSHNHTENLGPMERTQRKGKKEVDIKKTRNKTRKIAHI